MKRLVRSGLVALVLVSLSGAARADGPSGVVLADRDRDRDAPQVTVLLHANDARATLERRQGTTTLGGLGLPDLSLGGLTQWETACVAPCASPVSANYTYRIAGDGLVPTRTFALPRQADGAARSLRIDADLGSSTGRVSGMVLTAGGAGAMLLGTAALVASPILSANDVGSQGFRTGVVAGGAGAMGLGVLMVAVGITLWATNGSSLRFEPAPLTTSKRPERRGIALLPSGLAF